MTMSKHFHTAPRLALVPPEEPLVLDADPPPERSEWAGVWIRAQSFGWRTLALVPGDDQTPTHEIANLLARLALEQGEPIRLADMRLLRPKCVDVFLEGLRVEATLGTRIVIATRSPATSVATVPIARAADCAILCASSGSTSLAAIRDTVRQVGRKHFVGSLVVRPPPPPPRTRRARREEPGCEPDR